MKPIYFYNLDKLRFFAFFLVFWQHGFADSFANITFIDKEIIRSLTYTGGIGVHIFFVISGFLITFLLLKEYEKKGRISVKNFYIRRILRIWPLYYLIMGLGIFLLPQLINTFKWSGNTYFNFLFLNNFDMENPNNTANVGIAWSVAIEEQFYLFWPLIFTFFSRNIWNLFIFCFFAFIVSIVFTFMDPEASYFHTLGNLNFLMAGCMGAIIYNKYYQLLYEGIMSKKKNLAIAIIIIALLILFKSIASIILLPFFYLYIILYFVSNNRLTEKKSIFAELGKYTYGMYMYHPIIIIMIKIAFDRFGFDYINNIPANTILSSIALITTIVLSFLSYELMEKKFLNLKRRFSTIETRI